MSKKDFDLPASCCGQPSNVVQQRHDVPAYLIENATV